MNKLNPKKVNPYNKLILSFRQFTREHLEMHMNHFVGSGQDERAFFESSWKNLLDALVIEANNVYEDNKQHFPGHRMMEELQDIVEKGLRDFKNGLMKEAS